MHIAYHTRASYAMYPFLLVRFVHDCLHQIQQFFFIPYPFDSIPMRDYRPNRDITSALGNAQKVHCIMCLVARYASVHFDSTGQKGCTPL